MVRRIAAVAGVWAVVCLAGCEEGVMKPVDGADGGAMQDSGMAADPEDDTSEGGGSASSDGEGSGGEDDGGSGDGGSGDGGSGDGGSGDGGSGDGGSGDDGEEEPPPSILPAEGGWTLTDAELVQDDCGVANFQDPSAFVAETWAVTHIDASTFGLAAGSDAPGDCEVNADGQFACAGAQTLEDLSSYGFNADMVVDTTFSGDLVESLDRMSGTTDIVVTCDGDCWVLELVLDFPCPMAIDMELTADAG